MAHQSEIEKLERRYEEKPSQWFAALAEEYRRAGHVDQALEIVRQGLEGRSSYVSGHIVLARCLLQQGNDEEASGVLVQVLELDAENIIALKVLSEIKERANDTAGSMKWLERLLEVDPMNQDAQENLDRLRGGEAKPEESAVAGAPDGIETEKMAGLELGAGLDPAPDDPSGAVEVPASEAGDLIIESAESAFGDDTPGDAASGVAADDGVIEQAAGAFDEAEVPEVDSPGVVQGEPQEPLPTVYQGIEEEVPVLETIPPDPVVDTAGLGHAAEAPVAEAPASPPEPGEGHQQPAVSDTSVEVLVPAAEGLPSQLAEADLSPVAEAAPEPLVTETMAQVYVSQGLYEEARGVYRQLLELEPDSAALRDKLAELERQVADAAAPPASEQPYAASVTGGVPSRAFLTGVVATAVGGSSSELPPAAPAPDAQARESATALAGLPIISESEPPPPPPPGSELPDTPNHQPIEEQPSAPSELPVEAQPAALSELPLVEAEPDPAALSGLPLVEAEPEPAALGGLPLVEAEPDPAAASEPPSFSPEASVPEGPSPLEAAFEAPEPDEPPPGEATHPASDSPSLAAVFGDEPPASGPLAAAEEPPEVSKAGKGDVSFDEFFGGSAPPSEGEGDPSAVDPGDALEDRDFKDWLKGLKS